MPSRKAIVLVVDANIFPAALFQALKLQRMTPRGDTDICIVTDSRADIEKAEAFGAPCRLIYFDPVRVQVPMRPGYVTQVTYYQPYCPALLATNYDRLLFIDADVSVEDNRLFSLLDLDMAGHPLAAVRDPIISYLETAACQAERQATKTGRRYFNSGLMMIDPAQYAALNLQQRVVSILHHTQQVLPLAGQTALNFALNGNWLELSPAFNMLLPLWKSFVGRALRPSVIHFAGPVNPWNSRTFIEKHSIAREMQDFFASSPWHDFAKRATGSPMTLAPIEEWSDLDLAGFVAYLTTTPFADVRRGLARLDPYEIPARLR